MMKGNFPLLGNKTKCLSGGYFNIIVTCIFLVIILAGYGCQTTGSQLPGQNLSRSRQLPEYQKIEGGGWVSIFLNLEQDKGPEISFEITSVELQADEQKYSLLSEPLVINSKNIGGGQLFVARNSLPGTNYGTLILGLRKVVIEGQSQKPGAADKDIVVEMKLPSMLNLREGDSHSLFIAWDVLSSIDAMGEFSPQMNVSLQRTPFLSDLLYVACPEIDTVYTIRTDRNWVISSLGVTGNPTYMSLAPALKRLYVLTPKRSAIQVIDLNTNKIVDNLFMPFDYQPSHMTVSPDNSIAYVLDEQGKSLISVDLFSGAIANRIALSFQPRYAVFLEKQDKLAVSSFENNAVYLLDPGSLINSDIVSVGIAPEGLLPWNNFLLVAESGSNSVSTYDLSTKQQKAGVEVGFSPRRLFLKNNQVYVSNFASSSITYMLSGQLNISGEIFLKGKPLELAFSESRRWMYAGDAERGGLHVIDSTSNRLSGFITLQAIPAGLAVLD